MNCLAVPQVEPNQPGLAQQIVESLLPAGTTTPKLLPLLFPMTRDADVRETHHRKAAEDIIDMLDAGQSVAMVTIGDPTIYSTCFYVKHKVEDKGFAVEVVRNSFNYSSSQQGRHRFVRTERIDPNYSRSQYFR